MADIMIELPGIRVYGAPADMAFFVAAYQAAAIQCVDVIRKEKTRAKIVPMPKKEKKDDEKPGSDKPV